MIIRFFNSKMEQEAVLTSCVSLYAVSTYNEMGTFTLELVANSENLSLNKIWRIITLDDDFENPYFITDYSIQSGRIVMNGYPLTYILSYRASTDIIKDINAEVAMKSLIDNMSKWDNLVSADLRGFEDVFSNQISGGSVLEYIQGIGQSVDMGFRIAKKDGYLRFEAYKPGLNENVKFATSLGNIMELSYVEDYTNYFNVAIVAGAGEGDNRVNVTAELLPTLKGYMRRELYVDARNERPEDGETDEEYRLRLRRIGIQNLVESFKFTNIKFDVSDYDEVKLGDIVPISLEEIGINFQARISETEIISSGNSTKRTIVLSNPFSE